MTPAGFPHSDIAGSRDACSSPTLFAAYHVLLRLFVPRHPPCALLRLTGSSLARQPSPPCKHTRKLFQVLYLLHLSTCFHKTLIVNRSIAGVASGAPRSVVSRFGC
jgi:hypothetical protein